MLEKFETEGLEERCMATAKDSSMEEDEIRFIKVFLFGPARPGNFVIISRPRLPL